MRRGNDGDKSCYLFMLIIWLVMERGPPATLELARAAGCRDFDLVARFAPHQTPPDGRGGGDETVRGVALFGRDEAVGHLLVALVIVEHDGRAVGDFAMRHPARI